jgi:hypothetical protein
MPHLFSNSDAVDGFRQTGVLVKMIAKTRPALQTTSFGATPFASCFFGESIAKAVPNNTELNSIEITNILNILKVPLLLINS